MLLQRTGIGCNRLAVFLNGLRVTGDTAINGTNCIINTVCSARQSNETVIDGDSFSRTFCTGKFSVGINTNRCAGVNFFVNLAGLLVCVFFLLL